LARPVIAITNPGNELSRLAADAQCGTSVPCGDSRRLAQVLRLVLDRRDLFAEMGRRGCVYLERNCSRKDCIGRIEAALVNACDDESFRSALAEA
jgi:hypothetical protein